MASSPTFRRLPVACAVGLLASLAGPPALAAEDDRAPGGEGDDPRWCRVCHQDHLLSKEALGASAHGDLGCRDCHTTFHMNPHEAVAEPTGEVAEALTKRGLRRPEAMAACLECHDDVAETPGVVRHGWKGGEARGQTPYCLDCHGNPHVIPSPGSADPRQRREVMNGRCEACHTDPTRIAGTDLSPDVVPTYEESVHGRKLDLGSERAPGCFDCHGGHHPNDLETDPAVACRKCHPGAGESFARLVTHAPLTAAARPVSFYTAKFFAWLTFVTILFLVFHVLMDLIAMLRLARRSAKE